MAETKKTATSKISGTYVPTDDDLVSNDGTIFIGGNAKVKVMIPKIPGQKEQPDYPVTLNGRTILIKRGVEVEVRKPYYEVIKNAYDMQDAADDFYYKNSESSK